jgi:ribosomal protein S1
MTSNQEDRPAEMPGVPEESYEQLLEEYSNPLPAAEGEVLQGQVLQVTDQGVIVDVGLKQEGVVPLNQVTEPNGEVSSNRAMRST